MIKVKKHSVAFYFGSESVTSNEKQKPWPVVTFNYLS